MYKLFWKLKKRNIYILKSYHIFYSNSYFHNFSYIFTGSNCQIGPFPSVTFSDRLPVILDKPISVSNSARLWSDSRFCRLRKGGELDGLIQQSRIYRSRTRKLQLDSRFNRKWEASLRERWDCFWFVVREVCQVWATWLQHAQVQPIAK